MVAVLFNTSGIFIVIKFLAKKAIKPLKKDERKKWLRCITLLFLITFSTNYIFFIKIELDLIEAKKQIKER